MGLVTATQLGLPQLAASHRAPTPTYPEFDSA